MFALFSKRNFNLLDTPTNFSGDKLQLNAFNAYAC